jgi:hypothetical protein
MGLFRKKPDPISERAKLLNEQIAALESEIKKLAEQKEQAPAPSPPAPPPSPAPPAPSASPFAAATPSANAVSKAQPRLRSTARPHGQAAAAAAPTQEPIFEQVDQDRIQTHSEPITPSPYSDLGVRKSDFASTWHRLKTHFRGPVASNPKLVHYLSAGSIQGLRPLRYEKRVARNRFIVLAVFLMLALWGIIAIFVSRK